MDELGEEAGNTIWDSSYCGPSPRCCRGRLQQGNEARQSNAANPPGQAGTMVIFTILQD
jgi:hypothetical protein